MRVQTILLIVNLIVLILPVGSIYFLKLFEDEQVRQTEIELTAQGATIVSVYRQMFIEKARFDDINAIDLGIPLHKAYIKRFSLAPQKIDLSKDLILPERPEPQKANISAESIFLTIGKQINPILRRTQLTTLAGMRILDYNGIVVASSRGEIGTSYAQMEEIQRSLKGESVSSLRHRSPKKSTYTFLTTSRDTGLRVYVSLPIIIKNNVIGTVLLSRTPKSVKKMLYDKKERGIAALAALLLIVILLTMLTSLTITRPLKELIRQSEQVAIGKAYQKPNLARPGVKEIQLLASAFAEMTERLEHRSNYIHNFAMHVSHEFKSPLTSTRGAIELLQNYPDKMPAERRNRFYKNIAQDNDRLQRLVTRLLELARADVFEPSAEETDLVHILGTQQEQYRDSNLAIHLKNAITSFSLPIGKEVLETITSNLFENSLQHGANQVMVEIIEDDGATIRCYDNGEGISEANSEHIFTPFFTTNRKKGGTGLGLQIIQSLLKAHHATIRHIPTSSGAMFEIQFAEDLN